MIEWRLTEHGEVWARSDDRALCSSRDPRKEAALWCEQHAHLMTFKRVNVVGIGVGYHLFAMKKRWPTLEVRAFETRHGLGPRHAPAKISAEFQNLGDNFELHFGAAVFSEALEQIPQGPILRFLPACGTGEKSLYETLLGQTPEAFAEWVEIAGYPELLTALQKLPDPVAVNIASFNDSLCEPQAHATKLIRTLKELVV